MSDEPRPDECSESVPNREHMEVVLGKLLVRVGELAESDPDLRDLLKQSVTLLAGWLDREPSEVDGAPRSTEEVLEHADADADHHRLHADPRPRRSTSRRRRRVRLLKAISRAET
jgi:hypothetical protein